MPTGDDGTSQEATTGVLMKESDHSYVMWCSGRIAVEGMLVQLKMVKRQDLINFMQRIAKPATDQIVSICVLYSSYIHHLLNLALNPPISYNLYCGV